MHRSMLQGSHLQKCRSLAVEAPARWVHLADLPPCKLQEDLVVSSSLDQTVRVWDIGGLKKKTVSGGDDMLRLPQVSARALWWAGTLLVGLCKPARAWPAAAQRNTGQRFCGGQSPQDHVAGVDRIVASRGSCSGSHSCTIWMWFTVPWGLDYLPMHPQHLTLPLPRR